MERKIRTIVVGVAEMHDRDPRIAPPGEDPVLAPVVELAERLGATLHVVHAFRRPDPVLSAYTHALQTEAALEQRREQIESRLHAQARRFARPGRIYSRGVEGDAAIQLCGFAEEVGADLLIVGTTRRGWLWHNLLGSTAERVLQRATVPVLVVRRPFARPVRRVLLTTDLSDLGPALHEAGQDVVEALFGREPLESRSLLVCRYDTETAARISQQLLIGAATTRLEEFVAVRRRPQRPTTVRVRLGNPSTEIVREAAEWKADLIVLGNKGQSGISGWLLGSTAAAALRSVSCNALVIPAACAAAWQPDRRRANERPAACGFPGTEEHVEEGMVLATA